MTMSTVYEYRSSDSPDAMPWGTATISRHRSLSAAETASVREHRRFARSLYGGGGAYLQRTIVQVMDGVDIRRFDAPDAS